MTSPAIDEGEAQAAADPYLDPDLLEDPYLLAASDVDNPVGDSVGEEEEPPRNANVVVEGHKSLTDEGEETPLRRQIEEESDARPATPLPAPEEVAPAEMPAHLQDETRDTAASLTLPEPECCEVAPTKDEFGGNGTKPAVSEAMVEEDQTLSALQVADSAEVHDATTVVADKEAPLESMRATEGRPDETSKVDDAIVAKAAAEAAPVGECNAIPGMGRPETSETDRRRCRGVKGVAASDGRNRSPLGRRGARAQKIPAKLVEVPLVEQQERLQQQDRQRQQHSPRGSPSDAVVSSRVAGGGGGGGGAAASMRLHPVMRGDERRRRASHSRERSRPQRYRRISGERAVKVGVDNWQSSSKAMLHSRSCSRSRSQHLSGRDGLGRSAHDRAGGGFKLYDKHAGSEQRQPVHRSVASWQEQGSNSTGPSRRPLTTRRAAPGREEDEEDRALDDRMRRYRQRTTQFGSPGRVTRGRVHAAAPKIKRQAVALPKSSQGSSGRHRPPAGEGASCSGEAGAGGSLSPVSVDVEASPRATAMMIMPSQAHAPYAHAKSAGGRPARVATGTSGIQLPSPHLDTHAAQSKTPPATASARDLPMKKSPSQDIAPKDQAIRKSKAPATLAEDGSQQALRRRVDALVNWQTRTSPSSSSVSGSSEDEEESYEYYSASSLPDGQQWQ